MGRHGRATDPVDKFDVKIPLNYLLKDAICSAPIPDARAEAPPPQERPTMDPRGGSGGFKQEAQATTRQEDAALLVRSVGNEKEEEATEETGVITCVSISRSLCS